MTAAFSSRMISHSVIAVAVAMRRCWPARQPSPQNSSAPEDGDDRFLALLGDDGHLDLALMMKKTESASVPCEKTI